MLQSNSSIGTYWSCCSPTVVPEHIGHVVGPEILAGETDHPGLMGLVPRLVLSY